MSNRVVLDASALLALLNSEEGSKAVGASLPGAAMSAVNVSEVVAKLTEAGMPEKPIRLALTGLGLDIFPFDEECAFATGLLRKETKQVGLSLADRACLALAQRLSVDVLTTDRGWKAVKLGVRIQVIR
ncbi:MAG TPA: type II toxin-antitoxin system VapC family toxin [Acidobacteriota bacterium]|jgi:PIN domain nuclease of toxin-antitoxin system